MQTIATSRKRVYNRTYFSESRRREAVSSLLLQVQVQDNRLTNHRTNKFVVLAFESSGQGGTDGTPTVQRLVKTFGPDGGVFHQTREPTIIILELGFPVGRGTLGVQVPVPRTCAWI